MTDSAPSSQSSGRSRRRRTDQRKKLLEFIKTYWIELLAALVVVVGLLGILLERAHILQLTNLLNRLLGSMDTALDGAGGLLSRFGLFDILGFIAVVGGFFFVMWRSRVRFLGSERWRARQCPKCGSEIKRIHRNWPDRILGRTFLPHSRRYQCLKCDWQGLRHRGKSGHGDGPSR